MSGLQAKILLDKNGQDLAIKHEQDVEPILEWNKAARSQEQKSDWGRHIARIPNVILVRWMNEEHARGNHDFRLFSKECDELVARKLKDPEWAYLRVDKPSLVMGWR